MLAVLFVLALAGLAPAHAQDAASAASDRLFEAIFNRDLDGVKTAVADGADFEAPLRLGRSGLDLAVDLGHFEIAHYLLALRQNRRAQLARSVRPPVQGPPPFVPASSPSEPAAPTPAAPPPFVAAPDSQVFREEDVKPGGPGASDVGSAPAEAPAGTERAPIVVGTTTAATPSDEPPVAVSPAPAVAAATASEDEAIPRAQTPQADSATLPAEPAAAPPPSVPAPLAAETPQLAAAASRAGETIGERETSRAQRSSLVFADDMLIGARFDRDSLEQVNCVDKGSEARVCALFATWPDAVADYFDVRSFVYTGTRALAGYEGGVVRRYYAQFDAAAYAAVAQYHVERFGPPTRRLSAPARLPDGAETDNEILVWEHPETGPDQPVVLELRQFDNVRRSSADQNFGVVQLYYEGSEPIFSRMSALDVMRLR